MKLILNYIICLVLNISFLLSCSSNNDKKRLENWYKFIDRNYQQKRSLFKPDFIDHFPKNLYSVDDIGATILGETLCNEYAEFILGVKYTKSEFDSISNNLIQRSLESYSVADTITLVYDIRKNNKNDGFKHGNSITEEILLQNASDNNMLPIPNFWIYSGLDFDVPYNLSEDYIVYVIESKPGSYLNEECVNEDIMPLKWIQGYSKGCAISTKKLEIVYWFIAW